MNSTGWWLGSKVASRTWTAAPARVARSPGWAQLEPVEFIYRRQIYHRDRSVTLLPPLKFMAYIVVSEGGPMTMLDRMRRHKGWLKWSLGIVVVTFVIFFVPDSDVRKRVGAESNDVIATSTAERSRGRVPRAYQQQVQAHLGVRRQHRRPDAQAAGHRPAHRPADGR